MHADVGEVRPTAELTLLHRQGHRPPQHGQLVLDGGGGRLLPALGRVALQGVGRDRACLPAAELVAEMVPGDAGPPEGSASAVLVAPAEAGFEVLEGEPLRLVKRARSGLKWKILGASGE
jgi:hypothetical protein